MKLQIKYFEQSNVNFRQNLNNFIFFNGTSTSSQLKPEIAFLLLYCYIL